MPGSACGINPEEVLERAACEARVHVNAYNRLRSMVDVQLVNLLERRLSHFAENPNGFETVLRRLTISDNPTIMPAPPPTFSRRLRGAWEPEVSVHRVMVEQSMHLQEGGLNRFLI